MRSVFASFRLAALAAGLALAVLYALQGGLSPAPAQAADAAAACPDPLIIQSDWLPGGEHGPIFALIGPDGTPAEGRYSGELLDSGQELIILQGGSGLGLGHGETAYSALYTGNSLAGLMPHLAFVDTDSALTFSRMFPTVQVLAIYDLSPAALIWDPATYPEGFRTIEDLITFGESNSGKIYLSTVNRGYGRYLLRAGVARSAFIEGYRGDLENFVINGGSWINQGFATQEVLQLESGFNWQRPVDYVLISDLGYDIYPSALAVAKPRLADLAPCLEWLIPEVQRSIVDFAADPGPMAALIEELNAGMVSPRWWQTPAERTIAAVSIALDAELLSNGADAIVGNFDFARIEGLLHILKEDLDGRARRDVRAEDVATNAFIDPLIGLPAGAP